MGIRGPSQLPLRMSQENKRLSAAMKRPDVAKVAETEVYGGATVTNSNMMMNCVKRDTPRESASACDEETRSLSHIFVHFSSFSPVWAYLRITK